MNLLATQPLDMPALINALPGVPDNLKRALADNFKTLDALWRAVARVDAFAEAVVFLATEDLSRFAAAPEKPAITTVTALVPKVRGLRAIDSPATRGLHPVYKAVWKALYAMARNTTDRVVRATYGQIAGRAGTVFGKAVAVDTTRLAVEYLAKIGVVVVLRPPATVQRYAGRFAKTPGEYRVPLATTLDRDQVRAAIRANRTPVANPVEATRKRRHRGRTSGHGRALSGSRQVREFSSE